LIQNIERIKPYEIIENKNFLSDVILEVFDIDFQDVVFQDGQITFTFRNCLFKNVRIENFDVINFPDISFQFVNCYIENFDANEIKSTNILILFNSSIFSGTIQNSNIKSVSINNCIIRNNIFIIGQKVVNISYTEENIFIRRWLNLFKPLKTNFLDLIKEKQSYHVYDSQKIIFRTNESKSSKRGPYRINYERVDEYKIGYYLQPEEKQLFNIHLSIKYNHDEENGEVKVINSYLKSLSLSGYSNSKISIDNSKITNWFIRDFSTQKEVNFYNICPLKNENGESKIEIHKSNLENIWFDNINFSDYNIVSFFRTKFGKSTFTSCNFPTDNTSFEKFKTLENVHYPDQKSDNYYKDQYEIFLQLKIILESTGNFYEAQKLQAISNDALKKIKQISCWDRAILWINGKSNNHGLSIKLPLIYFLCFSIIFYMLYLLSLGRIFNGNKINYSLIGYYFSFIDLTHRTDFLVAKDEFNIASLSIDFINKLLCGFFIYQFVSAFRKYGKK
jgi:hypothetical protein